MELKTYFAQDAAGNIISSAIVNVFLQGTTTLATGLTRADGTPLENPFAADGAGRIQFRAPDGYYDVQVSAGPGIIQTLTIQCVDYSEAKSAAEQAQDALNSITGINTNFEQNSREQWRRSLAEAGLTLVSGSFEEGATANSSTDAVWHIAGGQCYTWGGALPKVVPADSTTTSTGGVSSDAWIIAVDKTLRAQISDPNGATLYPELQMARWRDEGDVRGWGAVCDGVADDTLAIQQALDTGRDLVLNGTCLVTGILSSKGQRITGTGSISTTRYSLGSVKAATVPPDTESLRMLYLESAYDLVELMHIKSIGFNTINHYCYFNNNGNIDAAGTVEKLLDNALTAGLQVNLGTEGPRASANLTEFVQASTNHPATFGYSVYDEPASRGISVPQQDSKITSLRALTPKPLSFVDLIDNENVLLNRSFSQNYDIAFVNSYSKYYSEGTHADWLQRDVSKFRYDLGAIQCMTGLKAIPVVSAFVATPGDFIYSRDIEQIIPASTIFGKVGEGNFGAFVWDGASSAFPGTVRNNQRLRRMCQDLASQRTRPAIKFEAYLFGGDGVGETHWPLNSLYKALSVLDPSTNVVSVPSNAYPMRLRTGTSDTDATTTLVGVDISGLGFKGDYAVYNSGIRIGRNFEFRLKYKDLGQGLTGWFRILSSDNNGYSTGDVLYEDDLTADKFLSGRVTAANSGASPDSTVVIRVETGFDTSTSYRKFLRGILISSDW